jgi:hypothetical protein
MGLSLTRIGKGILDQVNPFDGGRTYKQQTPTNNRSVFGQLTHNGVTNFAGNEVKAATAIPRGIVANITNNTAAQNQAGYDLQKGLGPIPGVARSIRDAVVSPIPNIGRALVTSPSEKLGSQYVNDASNYYHYSPSFKSLIDSTHPVADSTLPGEGGFNDAQHGGFFGRYNSLHFATKDVPKRNIEQNVTHEGLHSAWSKLTSQQRQQFLVKAQQAVGTSNSQPAPIPRNKFKLGVNYDTIDGKFYEPTDGLNDYLDSRLSSGLYPGYQHYTSLNQLSSLPDSLQTEIHSFIPIVISLCLKNYLTIISNILTLKV